MNGEKARWESRVECLTAPTAYALAAEINEFYGRGDWVVGTQVFPDGDVWTGLVYYKVRV